MRIEYRSCIAYENKKQYNFLFYAKNPIKYLAELRIVLKVVMLYSLFIKW